MAPTDETCQEPFPAFTKLPNFPQPTAGLCLLCGDGGTEGAPLFPGWQQGGHRCTNHPFAWKRCKIHHGRSCWKSHLQEFSGLHREWAGGTMPVSNTVPCTTLGPTCAKGLVTLPGDLCLMAWGKGLGPGKVHVWCCRGGWGSDVPPKEPYPPTTSQHQGFSAVTASPVRCTHPKGHKEKGELL